MEKLVTFAELPAYGIPNYCRVHLKRLIRRGQFPAAVQCTPGRIAWKLSELEAWKASRPIARSVLPKDAPDAAA